MCRCVKEQQAWPARADSYVMPCRWRKARASSSSIIRWRIGTCSPAPASRRHRSAPPPAGARSCAARRDGARLRLFAVDTVWLRRLCEGIDHRKRRSRRRPGVWYLARWPSARTMRSLRAKLCEATGRRNAGRPVGAVVADLNRVRRGWGNFFRWGNPAKKFWNIDRYVYERLERFLRAKHGAAPRATADVRHLPTPGRQPPDENDPRPPCACLTINDAGKPCDREGHARFDGGREESGASRLAARHWRLPPTRPSGSCLGAGGSVGWRGRSPRPEWAGEGHRSRRAA
jgi:hypothetical protein